MEQLKRDRVCGCFYCGGIFDPAQITEWLIDNNPCDRCGTAIYPHCGIDSGVNESSGFPITEQFLKEKNQYLFG